MIFHPGPAIFPLDYFVFLQHSIQFWWERFFGGFFLQIPHILRHLEHSFCIVESFGLIDWMNLNPTDVEEIHPYIMH